MDREIFGYPVGCWLLVTAFVFIPTIVFGTTGDEVASVVSGFVATSIVCFVLWLYERLTDGINEEVEQ